MKPSTDLRFKIASEDWEFEQIHRLNYETFVEEIPQHGSDPDRKLIDRFHDENTYIVCLRGNRLIGMVAVRDKRPFSLDQKLENLDSYLPGFRSICEIRLLAIKQGQRSSRTFQGLATMLVKYCQSKGYDLAVISGTVRQQKLFTHLGFVPFGPLVGTTEAQFQPMYRAFDTIAEEYKGLYYPLPPSSDLEPPLSFLPGPVGIGYRVQKAFIETPVSHRSEAFRKDFNETKRLLCRLVNSKNVEVFMGSGTLANDVIAGQLSLNLGQGIVISNGEFGRRLIDQARRFGLSFESLEFPWGREFDADEIERIVSRNPETAWIWAVHCETSTGVLNNMSSLKELCSQRQIKLCMDCVSTVGTISVDLRGVYLASSVSGKGLGSFPGLSMVFYDHRILPAPKTLPRYLDLGFYAAHNGIPFTISSNLLYALKAALGRFQSKEVFSDIVKASTNLKSSLCELGFNVVALDAHTSPAVITIALPESVDSGSVGRRMEEAGYLLSYNSDYLRERNWIQICLMGDYPREMISTLLGELADIGLKSA